MEYNFQPFIDYIQDNLEVLEVGASVEDDHHEEEIEPLECKSFAELVGKMRETLDVNIHIEMVLATVFAVKHSVAFRGLPLWMFIVGPPSSGKTTMVEQVTGDTEGTYSISKLKGIHSGWKESPDDDEDHGLLPKINKKCLVIKDFTTLLNTPRETREEIMGELRDAYDGSATAEYRNAISRRYNNINFSVLACSTFEILGEVQNQAAMGERFLMVNITDRKPDDTTMVGKAINNTITALFEMNTEEDGISNVTVTSHAQHELKRASCGFMQLLKKRFNEKKPVTMDEDQKHRLICLAQFVAFMRAKVSRSSRNRQLDYRPVREFGGRLGIQFTKLAISLCYVLGKKKVDDSVMAIIYKIAKDTCQGFSQEIVNALYESDEGLTIDEISKFAETSKTTARQKLIDLSELQVVEAVEEDSFPRKSGRQKTVFVLTDDFFDIMETCFAQPPKIPETYAKQKTNTPKKLKRSKAAKRSSRGKKTKTNPRKG